MILKLSGMTHREMELYKVCILDHSPWTTLTYLSQGHFMSPMHLKGENC